MHLHSIMIQNSKENMDHLQIIHQLDLDVAVSYEIVPVLTYGLVTLYGDNTFHGQLAMVLFHYSQQWVVLVILKLSWMKCAGLGLLV